MVSVISALIGIFKTGSDQSVKDLNCASLADDYNRFRPRFAQTASPMGGSIAIASLRVARV